MQFFCEISLHFCFFLHSKDWYLATSRHWIILFSLRFFFYFHDSHQGPLKAPNQFLLAFWLSRVLSAQDFLNHLWRKAIAKSIITTNGPSAGLRCPVVYSGVEIFPILYNFPDAHTFFVLTPSVEVLSVNTTFLLDTHAIYVAFLLRKQLR